MTAHHEKSWNGQGCFFQKSHLATGGCRRCCTSSAQGRAGSCLGSASLMERTFWPALFPNTSLFDLFLGIFMCSLMLYNTRAQGLISCLCYNNEFVVSIRSIHNVKCNFPEKVWLALLLGARLNWTEFGSEWQAQHTVQRFLCLEDQYHVLL